MKFRELTPALSGPHLLSECWRRPCTQGARWSHFANSICSLSVTLWSLTQYLRLFPHYYTPHGDPGPAASDVTAAVPRCCRPPAPCEMARTGDNCACSECPADEPPPTFLFSFRPSS